MSVGMHACDSASEGESESVRERREGERERERACLVAAFVSCCFCLLFYLSGSRSTIAESQKP